MLLLSSALVAPSAFAQSQDEPSPPTVAGSATTETAPLQETSDEQIEISGPGADAGSGSGEIIVRGFIPEVIRSTSEVLTVLGTADLERTSEGDVAGALTRVTGLSVVGGRFVYVRGLGERYSLALLNGSPLPSPEPLRRVVPLDIFPTNIISSVVVQKSYSVDYPGEFGGGVINLTTLAVPKEPFLSFDASIGADTETTFQLGYTYFGSDTDFTGFDDGSRDIPAPLLSAIQSNKLVVVGQNFNVGQLQEITASLANASTTVVQRNREIQPNFSINVNGGTSFELGEDFTLGVVAALGYNNSWQTRGGLQEIGALGSDGMGNQVLTRPISFQYLSTDNRLVVNGLFGLGAEFGNHKVRWTNLFIRDTIKEARIQSGTDETNVGTDLLNRQFTSWFERQLLDTQVVGEFKFGDFGMDLRGTYAETQRESPYERSFSYRFNDVADDFVNDLRSNGNGAVIAFSDLKDVVLAGAADFSYAIPSDQDFTLSAGYAYLKNTRDSVRREFTYRPLDALPFEVTQQRPDFLVSDFNVYNYDILLTDTSGTAGAVAFDAGLEVHAGYVKIEADVMPTVQITAGVRYEDGRQFVNPIDIFGLGGGGSFSTEIAEDYWLPATTLTWTFAENMQLRLAASRTIARPQFRELSPQQYLDTESDRTFFGNQFLTDSELTNAEARYEWYFNRGERLSIAGFFKKIDRPIEVIAIEQGGTNFTTFANAPEATLYGGEIEFQKYIPLDTMFSGDFFLNRRLVVIGNYTYSKSKVNVSDGDTTIPPTTVGTAVPASDLFVDGSRLTGQSDHIANFQFGLEDTDRLSQQTILLTYASARATNRGPNGQPDLIERPGLRLDFVARQAVDIAGREFAVKFEVRNITGQNYSETQRLNGTLVSNNVYDLGTTISFGIGTEF